MEERSAILLLLPFYSCLVICLDPPLKPLGLVKGRKLEHINKHTPTRAHAEAQRELNAALSSACLLAPDHMARSWPAATGHVTHDLPVL